MNIWDVVLRQIGDATYLKKWIASLVYKPLEPLPYLFIYGIHSGKSMFVNALRLLVPDTVDVGNFGMFNGPMATALLCVIRESVVKPEWVWDRYITIQRMREEPKTIKNKTHWIQLSNQLSDKPKLGSVMTFETQTIARPVHPAVLMMGLKSELTAFKEQLNDCIN